MSEKSLSARPKNAINEDTNAMPTGTHSPLPEKGPEDTQNAAHLSSLRLSAIVFSLCLAVFLCGLVRFLSMLQSFINLCLSYNLRMIITGPDSYCDSNSQNLR